MEMLTWDGSYLGSLCKKNITISKVGKEVLWTFTYKESKCQAFAVSNKGMFPCIVDELKPIFGLSKVGTHSARVGGKIFILRKPLLIDGKVCQDILLSDKEVKICPLLAKQIRDIFAFRFIMCVSTSFNRYIHIRKEPKKWSRAVSYNESSFNIREGASLTQTVLKKWFSRVDLDTVVKGILNPKGEDMVKVIARYRNSISEVILRVDKELILLEDEIIHRISNLLGET